MSRSPCKAAHFTLQNPDMDHSKCCPPTLLHALQTAEDSGCFLPRSPPCISLIASFPGPSPLQSPSAVQGQPGWSSSRQGNCRWSGATGNEAWGGGQGGQLLSREQLPGDGPGAGQEVWLLPARGPCLSTHTDSLSKESCIEPRERNSYRHLSIWS